MSEQAGTSWLSVRRSIVRAVKVVAAFLAFIVFDVLFTGGLLTARIFDLLLLFVGWYGFMERTLPGVTINAGIAAVAIVSAICFATGAHLFLGWLYRYYAGGEEADGRRWRLRWTIAGFLIFVLMFTAGISTTGAVHQAYWLASSPRPLYVVKDWRVLESIARGQVVPEVHEMLLNREDRLPILALNKEGREACLEAMGAPGEKSCRTLHGMEPAWVYDSVEDIARIVVEHHMGRQDTSPYTGGPLVVGEEGVHGTVSVTPHGDSTLSVKAFVDNGSEIILLFNSPVVLQ